MAEEATPRADRSSPLWKTLKKLTNGLGVQEPDVNKSGALIPELCRLWHIDLENDSPAIVRAKVTWQVEQLCAAIPPSPKKQIVIVCFNLLATHGKPVPGNLTKRQEWLSKGLGSQDRELGKGLSNKTIRRYLDETLDAFWLELRYNPPEPTPDAILSGFRKEQALARSEKPASTQAVSSIPFTDSSDTPKSDIEYEGSIGDAIKPQSPLRRLTQERPLLVAASLALIIIVATAIIFWPNQESESAKAKKSTTSPAIGNPLRIESIDYMRDGTDATGAWSYAFDHPLSDKALSEFSNARGDNDTYQKLAGKNGGVNPKDARLQIGVSNTTGGTIVIRDLKVDKQCSAPLTSALLYEPSAGPSGDIGISFDLDKQFPVAMDPAISTPYFAGSHGSHTIQLRPGEKTTLQIDATTTKSYCEFTLNAFINAGNGQQVVQHITDGNKKFQVTAIASSSNKDGGPKFSDYQAVYAFSTRKSQFISAAPATFNGAEP